ncbi:MAG: SDR family oxidoreductase [Elusimicrobiota bacterium]
MAVCLITGATGKLGSYFVKAFSKKYEVVAGYIENPEIIPENIPGTIIDLLDESLLGKNIEKVMPGVIIHCAAIKDVSYCEQNPERAREINTEGTKRIAQICRDLKATLVYLSSDYVFEGTRGCYREDEEPNPKTHYGKTKLEGEKAIQKILTGYVICRTGGVYGYKDDFVDFVVNTTSNNNEIKAFSDIFNTPTYLPDLADNIIKILEKKITGVFHLAGYERLSRFDFAVKIAKIFQMDLNLVVPLKYERSMDNFLRPVDCSLSSESIRKKTGIRFRGTDESLKKIKELKKIESNSSTSCQKR